MKYSSNIGVAKLAFKMGAGTFVDYLHKFGFGSETGIPLPGERSGRIRDPEEIKPIELATTAFGQGTTATPIQLAMGIATIANGGVRMKPRLVTRVEDYYGVPDRVIKPAVAERAVSEETARKTREMMALVTEAGGTGTRARVPGYVVAGKTGTAQKVKDGRYSEARIGSFVGFVPADDPVIAVVVIVDEPTQGSRYGGIAAAPAFAEIAGQTLRHLGVPPDPALLAEAGEADPEPEPVTGDETTVEDEEESLRLAWNGDTWTMPDLTGRSRRDVLVGLQSAGLKLELSGSGSAVAQKPSPGEILAPGSSVSVVFQ
jgi:cell division protein FtsI (penicillin-binding protein 3)